MWSEIHQEIFRQTEISMWTMCCQLWCQSLSTKACEKFPWKSAIVLRQVSQILYQRAKLEETPIVCSWRHQKVSLSKLYAELWKSILFGYSWWHWTQDDQIQVPQVSQIIDFKKLAENSHGNPFMSSKWNCLEIHFKMIMMIDRPIVCGYFLLFQNT